MRIISGMWRGRTIAAPKGVGTRPTIDRTREAIISRLVADFGLLDDLLVLDGFAGSGALGLEVLSRGAQRCVFVDRDKQAYGTLLENIRSLAAVEKCETYLCDSLSSAPMLGTKGPFDIILLDPPYILEPDTISMFLSSLVQVGAVALKASVVYEHSSEVSPVWPEGFQAAGSKRYGTTTVSYADYEG